MDKHLSENDQKMLLNALEKAKEMRQKEEAKEEAKEEEKRWSAFELPLTLAGSLAKLTKGDLSTIRSNLGIKGASALKKQELIDFLVQKIPDVLPEVFNTFDETRYKIMKHIAGRGGQAFLPLESHQLNYFRDRGLIFTGTYNGKKMLAIPQEVLACFEIADNVSYQETIQRNTECIKLTQGMLYYYGTLEINELENLLKNYMRRSNLKIADDLQVIEESQSFYRGIKFDKEGLSNIRVFDGKRVKEEHRSRPELPFYRFSKAQLLRAGEAGFVDRNPSYEAFVDFIRNNYSISQEEADSLVEECVYAIQIGEAPGKLLQFLQYHLEINELRLIKGFMEHIVNLNNTTRQWFLKGYSPQEISPSKNRNRYPSTAAKGNVFDFATRKKVGRNDPCPCGSGKKFKKCCLG